MEIQVLGGDSRDSCVALWHSFGLARPWNVLENDWNRAFDGPSSTVLGVVEGGAAVASAMISQYGHRGLADHLAVDPSRRHFGLGAASMDAAMEGVRRAGITRIQLTACADNAEAERFYRRQSLRSRPCVTSDFRRQWRRSSRRPEPLSKASLARRAN